MIGITHFLSRKLGVLFSSYFSKKLDNPVFVIGSGRSGTTLLMNLLSKHELIACFPEEALDLWHPKLYPYHKSKVNAPPIWVSPEEFTKSSVDSWPYNHAINIRGIFGAYHWLSRKPVFINKTVMNNFMLPIMQEIYPQAKFIHLYRNGLSVALSYQKKEFVKYQHERYRPYLRDNSLKVIREMHAKYWNETILKIEKDGVVLKPNFLELSYEELVSEPYKSLESICSFIELPMSNHPDMTKGIEKVENRNVKVDAEISTDEIAQLKVVMRTGTITKYPA